MAFIRYPHIQNRSTIVNWLIKQGKPLDVAARKLKVPYGCLLNQARNLLTEEELEIVRENSKRRRFTWTEKRDIVRRLKEESVAEVSEDLSIHPGQLRAWRRQIKAKRAAKRAKNEEKAKQAVSMPTTKTKHK